MTDNRTDLLSRDAPISGPSRSTRAADDGVGSPYRATGTQYDVVTHPLPAGIEVDHNVRVRMRDGVHLAASVYRPSKPGKFPAIAVTSPYGKTAFKSIEKFSKVPGCHLGRIEISDSVSFEAPDPGYWVPADYVVVQLDTRGQGDSEGDFGAPLSQAPLDYIDAIQWISEQPWCDGKVAGLGVSFLAAMQWMAAQHRPPALKAIVPWEVLTDRYRVDYPGGIPEVGFRQFSFEEWTLPNKNPMAKTAQMPPGMSFTDHPLWDEYWERGRLALEKIEIPVLICASFSDQGLHSRDSFENFNLVSSKNKWLYSHRGPKWASFYSPDAVAYQRAFLDRFVKGIDNGFETEPRVRLQVYSDREHFKVQTAEAWPVPNSLYKKIDLAADGILSERTTGSRGAVAYEADRGRAVFDYCFAESVDIVGNMKLKLHVEVEGADDMDLFVGIQKFDRSGQQVYFYGYGGTNSNDLVARGWLRVSHRDLDPAASRPDRPVHKHTRLQKLTAGEIVPVEIEILPSGTSFVRGETLRVVIQGQPILPDSALLNFKHNNVGTHKIWFGGEYDSFLLVPWSPATWMA